ncbi:hypothetical protein [Acidaminobacter hydrogenoformans]|uniref:Uncharacterized protein n=1 Tax=Acidaminobacter hydrogenoformans DSM 2784 TaxID=1120920 RepID=A0A1G5S791_9FIRM|nr:hypothetical protein [Acidaminobacter hydrogenoformans]SCZ82088.1 hypothetical protein SAMN03080599_03345 [Acidaminobacter hydrogenoformans DSM 2784]
MKRKEVDPNSPHAKAIQARDEARKAYLERCARASAARMKLLSAHGALMGAMSNYHAIGGRSEDIDTLDLIVRELDRQMAALEHVTVTGGVL